MTDKAHTPGPWDHCCDSSPRVKHMKTACVVADRGGSIDLGNGVRQSTSVKVARGIANWKDACLIAAAPDLLAACKAAYESSRLEPVGENDRDCWLVSPEAIEQLRSALAKAKGGAS